MECFLVFGTHEIAKKALCRVDFTAYYPDYCRKQRKAFAPSETILAIESIAALKAHPILRDLRNLRDAQDQFPMHDLANDTGVKSSTPINNSDQISHTPTTDNFDSFAPGSSSQAKMTNAVYAPRIALDELTGNIDSSSPPSKLPINETLYSALENENENDESLLIPWGEDPELLNQLLTLLEVNKRWRVGIYGPVVSENGFTVSKKKYYREIASALFSNHPSYRKSHSLNKTVFASLIGDKLKRHV